jgi:hypothetical protein
VDNVTPLGPRQLKNKAKKNEDGNLSLHEKQRIVADWLEGDKFLSQISEPDLKFITIKNIDLNKRLFNINDQNELIACDLTAVEHCIAKSVHHDWKDLGILDLTDQNVTGCARYWFKITQPIPEPPMFGWVGEQELCMRRIPFERKIGPTPIWDELLGRITNAEAFRIWIGSVLAEDSDMQQYVWLYGQGGEGKGAISRFLARALGHTHSSQQPPNLGDRFWTWGIRNSRLVVFADCNNTKFVTSGLFKSLSGADPVRIEIKGGAISHQLIKAKYLFLSNEKPDLSSETADKRRIIYCTAQPFYGKIDPCYQKKLWEEGGYFLSKCLEMYREKCPNGEQINADSCDIDDVISTNEEIFASFLESNFFVGPNETCSPIIFNNLIVEKFKTKADQKAFRNYLDRMNIRKIVKRDKDRIYKVYVGLKPRSIPILDIANPAHFSTD